MPWPDDIVVVRIPELPLNTAPLTLTDRLVMWNELANETRGVELSTMRTFLMAGLTASTPPVYVGGSFVWTVTAAEAGGTVALIPELAGMTFNIRRGVRGMLPINEWEVLDAGGFKLTKAGDFLVLGETFELDTIEFQTNNQIGAGLNFDGAKPIPTNYTILPDEVGRVFQIRAGATVVTITLPNIVDIPLYSILPFEADITNSWQAKIQTVGGQKIYLGNQERTHFYIGKGEIIWLYCTADGWFAVNAYGNWAEVGKIVMGFSSGMNEMYCDGSPKSRANFPRLWEYIQTISPSVVTDAVWNTASAVINGQTYANPYRGFFSSGDGSTTFRVPDLQNRFLRGIKEGTDSSRSTNVPGALQKDQMKQHFHFTFVDNGSTYNRAPLTASNYPERRQGNGTDVLNANYEYSITGNIGIPTLGKNSTYPTVAELNGADENRPENIGTQFYIKF